jgi:NADPH:quinone reductase-like Zn-dependent oxidoreductase
VVDTLPEPRPGIEQVLVKTLASGICGSDLHAQACPSLQALKPALIFDASGYPACCSRCSKAHRATPASW